MNGTDAITSQETVDVAPASPAPKLVAPFALVAAAAAWLAFLGLALAVQPAIDPDAPANLTAELLSLGLFAAMFASIAGLASRARFGLMATAVGGAFLLGTAIACFADGHTGGWVFTQGLAGIGLAATGTALHRVSR